MKKNLIALALWASLGAGIASAQKRDVEITAKDFAIDEFAPQYAWDFAGGPFMFAGEMMETSTTQQLVVIIDKKRAQYYDLKGAGNYIGRDLPSPVVLLSNASRNVFAYSGTDNKIRIASSLEDMHTINETKPAQALALGNASDKLAVAIKNEAGKTVIKLYEHGLKDVKLLKTLEGVDNLSLAYLAFSEKDSKILATDGETVIVWSIETGKEIGKHTMKKELMMDKVRMPTIAEKTNTLAYVKNKQTVVLIDLDKNTPEENTLNTEKMFNTEKLAQDIHLSEDGKYFYICNSGSFWKFDVTRERAISNIYINEPMTFCTFSPNGLFALVVPFKGNEIKVVRLPW